MKLRRISFRVAVLVAFVYVAACITLMAMERSILYQPRAGAETPQEANLSGYERHYFAAADGTNIPYWEHAEDGVPILLYFHGNGGGLYGFARPLDFLAHQHFQVMAMEYRGYPAAAGKPSEHALVGDAETFYDMVRQKYPHRKILVWGYSLGSGVAVQIAAAKRIDALVLEAPFTATVDRAEQLFPWAPVQYFMRDQYRSRDFIGKVRVPIFIMHGNADRIIPIALGRALYALANEPKIFREYAGAGHLNLIGTQAYADAASFLHSVVNQAQ